MATNYEAASGSREEVNDQTEQTQEHHEEHPKDTPFHGTALRISRDPNEERNVENDEKEDDCHKKRTTGSASSTGRCAFIFCASLRQDRPKHRVQLADQAEQGAHCLKQVHGARPMRVTACGTTFTFRLTSVSMLR
jgi:hypothetical protein